MVSSHGSFVWYELVTTDVRAAMAFYTKVMGWGAWDASAPGRPFFLFTDGAVPVAGLARLSEEARRTGTTPNWVGYVGVEDVDAAARRIEQHGGTVHVPPTTAGDVSRFSVVTDPEGVRLGLFKWLNPSQAPPAAPQDRRRVGWHELLSADQAQAWAFYSAVFGWQSAQTEVDDTIDYYPFSAGADAIGGMITKPAEFPDPFWLYYFNVGDIDATAARIRAAGGQMLDGPFDAGGDRWIVHCADPQGAIFALEGQRSRNPVGYFERAASPNPGSRSCRWSW